MAVNGKVDTAELTLGPVLFNWKPEVWRDFYFRIADEAPVSTVYVGEAICSKRAPFFEPVLPEVTERLKAAGKTVVISSLSEVMLKIDRKLVESVCAIEDFMIEVNDVAALYYIKNRPFHVGPLFNAYNEDTMTYLAGRGARNVCVPNELPGDAMGKMAAAMAPLGISVETLVFGRQSLALSARCYHARAHGRTKDSCQLVCEEDADGMDLNSMEGKPFLAVNGIQTLSYTYVNLLPELAELRRMGVNRFRLSPHNYDMVAIANIFRDTLDGKIEVVEAQRKMDGIGVRAPFSNGFYHRKPGYTRVGMPAE